MAVGIKEVHDDIWLVSFMDLIWIPSIWITLVLNAENPFSPKVLAMGLVLL